MNTALAIYLTVITANTQWHAPKVQQFKIPDTKTCIEVLKQTKQLSSVIGDSDAVDHLTIMTVTCGGKQL